MTRGDSSDRGLFLSALLPLFLCLHPILRPPLQPRATFAGPCSQRCDRMFDVFLPSSQDPALPRKLEKYFESLLGVGEAMAYTHTNAQPKHGCACNPNHSRSPDANVYEFLDRFASPTNCSAWRERCSCVRVYCTGFASVRVNSGKSLRGFNGLATPAL